MSDARTPGLWKAIPPARKGQHWSVGVVRVLRGSRAHAIVARIDNGAPGDTLETEGANARLIAAAPDLLEACQTALWACRGEGYDPERFDRAVGLCEAALAKARGTP